MTHEYNYELVDGHIILEDSGRSFLLDTGSPVSICDAAPLLFAGREFDVSFEYEGVTTAKLSKWAKTRLNGLLGADILNKFDFMVDPAEKRVVLGEEEMPLDGDLLEAELFGGVPIVKAAVGEEHVRMFFDTGAKISYLDPKIGSDCLPDGEERDFYPGLGEFTTPVRVVPTIIGGREIKLRAGILPQQLKMALMSSAGTADILGSQVFETFKVCFAPRREKICLKNRG